MDGAIKFTLDECVHTWMKTCKSLSMRGFSSPMIVAFTAFLETRKNKSTPSGPYYDAIYSMPLCVYSTLPFDYFSEKGPIVMNTTIINIIIHVPSDPSHVCGNFRIKKILFLTSGSVTQSVNKSEIG